MKYPMFYINLTMLATEIRTNQFKPDTRIILSSAKLRQPTIYTVLSEAAAKESKLAETDNSNDEEEEETVKGEVRFNYFDFVVSDALYSLYQNKRETNLKKTGITVSLGEILRIMSGNPKQTLTEAKKNRLRQSIGKLRKTFIIIKYATDKTNTSEYNAEAYGYLAPLRVVDKDSSGKALSYEFTKAMPLYTYAQDINQIAVFPTRYMDTTEPTDAAIKQKSASVRDTNEAVMIKHYLIKRLALLENKNNNFDQPKIAYVWHGKHDCYNQNGMLHEIGITRSKTHFATLPEWRQKVESVDIIVRSILDHFHNAGIIFGYDRCPIVKFNIPVGVTIKSREGILETNGNTKKKTKAATRKKRKKTEKPDYLNIPTAMAETDDNPSDNPKD